MQDGSLKANYVQQGWFDKGEDDASKDLRRGTISQSGRDNA